ncbi:MAG TPA: glycosyl hydrolase family 18 protein [Polyangiaceae bacterium]|nr:glycosyl hydrolase family 18 protein [Polyangiaceae bacterium]
MIVTPRLFVSACLLSAATFAVAACGGSSKPADAADAGGADSGGAGGGPSGIHPNRVVGYIPTWRSLVPSAYDLASLTHLNIAFANPTADGGSDFDEPVRPQILPLVQAAQAEGVLVLASIAGGSDAGGGAVAAQIVPELRDAYIASLLGLVERYGLDGIDVDIEGEYVNADYEPFVKELRAALPTGKLLTAAVSIKNGDSFSDAALAEYDFINVMAYDYCSWTDEACDQAGLEKTQDDLAYWTETRSLPTDKTVLGVPFYGWCWGCADKQTAMTYASILAQYPQAETEDWIEDGAITISLNSRATIATKTEWGRDYGGIMIWELGQDASGTDSLMSVVAAGQD